MYLASLGTFHNNEEVTTVVRKWLCMQKLDSYGDEKF
jgi:hypothetical protein